MDVFKLAERLMGMDDRVWRRHANPLSGWSRMTVLPLLCLAVWSRVWLNWGALVPLSAVLVWVWLNPRIFPEPSKFDAWMSRGVLGERVFLTYRAEVAQHHHRVAMVLGWLSLPGLFVMVWGLVILWWEGVVFGMILAMLPKVWFVDRMVWILQDWRDMGRSVPGMRDDEL